MYAIVISYNYSQQILNNNVIPYCNIMALPFSMLKKGNLLVNTEWHKMYHGNNTMLYALHSILKRKRKGKINIVCRPYCSLKYRINHIHVVYKIIREGLYYEWMSIMVIGFQIHNFFSFTQSKLVKILWRKGLMR